MGIRGKKSAASLAVVGPEGVEAVHRPNPPSELTDEQAEIWRFIVAGYSADRFDRGSQPLLAQYCRHAVAAQRVAQLIEQAEGEAEFDVLGWNDLLRIQERQSAPMAQIATKLRITPQSRYTPQAAATLDGKQTLVKKPWQD